MRRAREHLAWSPVVVSWCSLCNAFNQSTFYLSSALRCAAGGWWCWLCVCWLVASFLSYYYSPQCACVQHSRSSSQLCSCTTSKPVLTLVPIIIIILKSCCIDHLDHHLMYKAWPCLGDVL